MLLVFDSLVEMKKLLGIVVLGLLWCNTSFAVSSLPLCQGEDNAQWTNCVGTYENKDVSKPDDEYKMTRDYMGEFGSTPGKREGKGKSRVYRDGKFHSTYVGEFKDGKANGQGTFTGSDGSKYVGEFIDDRQNGQGTETYANGDKYVGGYKDGKKHGQGTYTWANGSKYVGGYKDGKRHGQGTYTWTDGDKYVGGYKDGKRHGQGTFTKSDGSKYVGEFIDDRQNGQGTYTFPNGERWVGEWENGDFYSGQKIQSESTKEKKAQKKFELLKLKTDAKALASDAYACYQKSTEYKRQVLKPIIEYIARLLENSELPTWGTSKTYRQIIAASEDALKQGGCW